MNNEEQNNSTIPTEQSNEPTASPESIVVSPDSEPSHANVETQTLAAPIVEDAAAITPTSIDQSQSPLQSTITNQPEQPQHHTDGLGIASIVMAFIGLQIVGLILGLVGSSKAKKENRSATLSKVGWILNLVFMVLAILVLTLVFINSSYQAQNKGNDTERFTDVNAIHANLEMFYNTNGYYPSEVSKVVLVDIDESALIDPDGNSYTYTPSPAGCTQCASYEISTELEKATATYPSGVYVKLSLNDTVNTSTTNIEPSSNPQ